MVLKVESDRFEEMYEKFVMIYKVGKVLFWGGWNIVRGYVFFFIFFNFGSIGIVMSISWFFIFV